MNHLKSVYLLNEQIKEEYDLNPKEFSILQTKEDEKFFLNISQKLEENDFYIPTMYFLHAAMGLRTVFIREENKFYEIKGYGRNGQEMYFGEHESGDVNYGMYLTQASREYETLKIAKELNLKVPNPVSLLEIPRENYIIHGLRGFISQFEASITTDNILFQDLLDFLNIDLTGKDPEKFLEMNKDLISKKVFEYLSNQKNLESTILSFVDNFSIKTPEYFWRPFWMKENTEVLKKESKIGYVIREVKSPLRLGLFEGNELLKYEKIAIKIGNNFRTLVENGILHHCPSLGNWTLEGELTDFSDTFKLSEKNQIQKHISKLKSEERIENEELRTFIQYLIGPEHTQNLSPFFIQGITGNSSILSEGVEKIIKLM